MVGKIAIVAWRLILAATVAWVIDLTVQGHLWQIVTW